MKLNPERLKSAVKFLDMVPMRAGIRPSEFVRMQIAQKQISFSLASDLVGNVVVPFEGSADGIPREFCFDRVQFIPLVQSLADGKEVEMTSDGGSITFRQGSRRATYKVVEPVSGYGKIRVPDGDGIVIDSDILAEISSAMNYTGKASMSPELMAVWYDSSLPGFLATDRFSVYASKFRMKQKRSMIFPAALIGACTSGVTFHPGDSWVTISSPDGLFQQSLTKQMAESFPAKAIRKAVDSAHSYRLRAKFRAGRLAEVLERMRACLPSTAVDTASVHVEISEGRLGLRMEASQVEIQESVKAETTSQESCDWLLVSVQPFLASLPADAIVEGAWEDGSPFAFRCRQPDRILLSPRRAS